MKEYSVLGKRVPRVDGPVKATGEARYTVDQRWPGMLYGKLLRSPHPHARILSVDTRRAERLPGVRAVLTGKDLTDAEVCLDAGAEPPVAVDKVRYIGQAVAAVAAADEYVAEEALDLIKVDYEELPSVFTPEEAVKEGAPSVHDGLERNMVMDLAYHFGDVEKGFQESGYVREDTFTTPPVHPAYLEPLVSAAHFDSDGRLTVWSSTQGPGRLRDALAATLRMKQGEVRVIASYFGGGFCGKTRIFPHDVCAALLSKRAGKPVKIEYSRKEIFAVNRGGQPTAVRLKTGVRRDGTLVAMECRLMCDTGAYFGGNLVFGYVFGTAPLMTYRLPNFRFQGRMATTNNGPYQSQRGSGVTPARFVVESQIDIIAADLGLDPVEMRVRNALQSGDVTANRSKISSCGLSECVRQAAAAAGWSHRDKLPPGRGMGISCYAFATAYSGGSSVLPSGYSSAFVHVHQDGTVTVLTGVNDNGQGIMTALAQIAAEELGVPVQNIRVTLPDTEITPYDFGTMGSRATYLAGNAVKAAAGDARRQIFELAAARWQARVEDLEISDGRVRIKRDPQKSIPFAALAQASQLAGKGKPVLGKGYFSAPDTIEPNLKTGEGDMGPNLGFGAVVAEVEVDRQTGKTTVLKITIAHDCGLPLNPMAVEGQLEGQIQAATGEALCEERLTSRGKVLNPSFADYRMPTALDMPGVKPIIVETIDTTSPLGIKECGEGPQGGVAPAIANAVYNAVGVRMHDLPMRPEKIMKAFETT
ncbi:MAG: molybdopterin-dependent oxidoreductase [Chloroflexi bacterium]|nr:molybdopterin-dependent oxidoreductase [Chloroflexota bacterium]